MVRLASRRTQPLRTLRGLAGCLVLTVALSLLAAPLHRALGHDHQQGQESQSHHCPICALAKGQVDAPACSSAIVVVLRAEVLLPAVEISGLAASIIDSLPPGRAPPVFIVPS